VGNDHQWTSRVNSTKPPHNRKKGEKSRQRTYGDHTPGSALSDERDGCSGDIQHSENVDFEFFS